MEKEFNLSKKIEKSFERYINKCCRYENISFSDIRTLQIALKDFKSICKRLRKKELAGEELI